MAFYRTISISFWTDSKVVDTFTPEDKYFYLYLFTNPHTNLSGCYEISMKQIVNETGYSIDTIENLIHRFEDFHKVISHSRQTKEILLLNWHKYNWTKSDKFLKSLEKEIQKVKNPEFRSYLWSVLRGDDTVSIPYGYRMDTSNTVTNTNTVSNSANKRGGAGGETVKESNLSDPVKEKVLDFLAYREEIKKPYKSERSIQSFVKQVEKQEQIHGSIAVIECIDKSIQSGWQGVFWDKIENSRPTSKLDMIDQWAANMERKSNEESGIF